MEPWTPRAFVTSLTSSLGEWYLQVWSLTLNHIFLKIVKKSFSGIDTDKYKYPIGSGRVAFNNTKSYLNAMAAAFIEIRTPKFTKKVRNQIRKFLCLNYLKVFIMI